MKMLDQINLTAVEKHAIREADRILKNRLPVSGVVLFGSKARGQATEESDIDLLVLTACPVTRALRSTISEIIADINLCNDVVLSSVVVYDKDWTEGLVHYLPLYHDVQRDGCMV